MGWGLLVCAEHCVLSSVLGCAQGIVVWFLGMSGISMHCVLGSVVGCVQGFGVWFLVYGTSEHCVLGMVVGCVQGFGVWFLGMSGISIHCVLGSLLASVGSVASSPYPGSNGKCLSCVEISLGYNMELLQALKFIHFASIDYKQLSM